MEGVYVCPECGRFVDYAGIFILPQNVAVEDLECVLCFECQAIHDASQTKVVQEKLFDDIEFDNPDNAPKTGELF